MEFDWGLHHRLRRLSELADYRNIKTAMFLSTTVKTQAGYWVSPKEPLQVAP
jgi:hypothetical protein